MFTEPQQSAEQSPATPSMSDASETVLPTRFARTSGAVLPSSTVPSTARQMTYVPSQQLTVSGFSTVGPLTE